MIVCSDYYADTTTPAYVEYGIYVNVVLYEHKDIQRFVVKAKKVDFPKGYIFLKLIYFIPHPTPAPPPRYAHTIRAPPQGNGGTICFLTLLLVVYSFQPTLHISFSFLLLWFQKYLQAFP